MAVRGRKPKLTAPKLLEGSPGKRSLNMSEPVPPKTAAQVSRMAGAGSKKGMEAACTSGYQKPSLLQILIFKVFTFALNRGIM